MSTQFDNDDEIIQSVGEYFKSSDCKHKKTIANVTAECLRRLKMDSVAWGDCGLIDGIVWLLYDLGISKIRKQHPLDRHISFLNRLEGSPLFEKCFYRVCGGKGGAEVLCRMFYLKETNANPKTNN